MSTAFAVQNRQSRALPSASSISQRPQTRPDVITVVIADSHALFREALGGLLEGQDDFKVIGEAGDGRTAVGLARTLRPAAILLDLRMPGGLETLMELSRIDPAIPTLIVADDASDEEVVEALECGARGVVTKRGATEHLFKSIRMVVAGQYWVGRDCVAGLVARMQRRNQPPDRERTGGYGLTARELELVAAVVDGCANSDIACQLKISPKTVKHHLTKIFVKLGVSNRLELALFAVEHQFRDGRFK
jgi:two-component system nitrate/nitrite response regulator NarL